MEVSSSKIDGFMATYISKLKWAWQDYCLSPTLLILKIYTFKDVQMMLKHFLISLLVLDIKRMKKSSPSIYRDVHGLCIEMLQETFFLFL